MAISTALPVVIRNLRTGGRPNLNGIGSRSGTPSFVNMSISKWLAMPIINAYQTSVMSMFGIMGCNIVSKSLKRNPNPISPSIEWLKNRWPPLSLLNIFPTNLVEGRLRQNGAVGWSISGAIPPSWFASTASSAVPSVTLSGGHTKTTAPSAVRAAKSCVRPVIPHYYKRLCLLYMHRSA